MKAGEIITAAHFRSIRPGFGAAPKLSNIIIGMRVLEETQSGTPVIFERLIT